MSDVPSGPIGQSDIVPPATRHTIDLDRLNGPIQDSVDLIHCTITGNARVEHEFGKHNFISCVFKNAFFRDIDLSGCDIKDTLVVDCNFSDCRINAATHTATVYKSTTFSRCNFHNAAITDSEYRDVQFVSCDLDNVLVKNTRLYDSKFVACITSTHVFENSIFVRTTFERSEIELRMLVSNFGLKAELMIDNRVRDARCNQPHGYVEENGIASAALSGRNDPLASLAIRYFVDGNLLGDSEGIDAAFDLRAWAQMARQPASFAQLIELFAEFLVTAFDNNEVDMHKLLLLHDVTRQIAYDCGPDAISHRYAVSFGGIHLALSRLVEEYLDALQSVWLPGRPDVWVVAEGPLLRDYHENHLAPFLTHCGIQIGEIQPYNSVLLQLVEVIAGGKLFALALILASFVKVELKAVRICKQQSASIADGTTSRGTQIVARQEPLEFFHIASGMTGNKRRNYELRVKSLIPTTSIVVDLKLAVATGFVRKVRKCIVQIVDDH